MPSKSIALYIISFIDGLMLDTFNLGIEVTRVNEQIDILFLHWRNALPNYRIVKECYYVILSLLKLF